MIAVTGVLCLVVAGWRISLWLHPPVHSDPSDDRATVKAKDGQSYVWIRPGLFLMGCSTADGSCYKDEKPSHVVTITKGFWLGQTEVKQEAFQRVMATNPSHFRGDRLPVESVSWEQAKSYCEATGMRLPTEAEWEYAARAGSSVTRYGDLDNIAYYNTNSGNHTNEVGQKQPNAWKLYDMIGNVWEWTNDWFDPDYYSSGPPPQDPKGPSHGEYHVIRGGSWISYPWILRVSFRYRGGPDVKPELIGFRCAGDTL